MKIKTLKLQEMLLKVIGGASNNKLISITQLIQLEVKNSVLELTTTDATNYIKCKQSVESEDFYVVVSAEVFAKLISKTTCEEVTLELTENALKIKGNGEYKIPIQLDEEGNLIKFPDKFSESVLDESSKQTIKKETIDKILTTNKAALATTLEIPCYTGYYFGENVISTDTFKICALNTKVFKDPVLISSTVVDLLKVITDEVIDVYVQSDDVIIWKTPSVELYSRQLDGIENYAVDVISGLIESDMENTCTVNKQAFLDLLDRLCLFVSPYDQNNVNINFQNTGIRCVSKQSDCNEVLHYVDNDKEHREFNCVADITMLVTQIKALPEEVFELHYGSDNAVKITSGNITQIISLNE